MANNADKTTQDVKIRYHVKSAQHTECNHISKFEPLQKIIKRPMFALDFH